MELDEGPRNELNERNDLDDLELATDGSPVEDSSFPFDDDDGPNWPLIAVGLLLLVAILGIYFGFFRGRQKALETASEAPPPVETAAPVETPAPAESPLVLPPLEASDAVVRELVSALAEHPRLANWLATEELLRRFTVAVDNVAEGRSPRTHLLFLDPKGDFEAVERDGVVTVDETSYERYNAPAELFVSLDASEVAQVYRNLEPLINESYQDLGYPDRRFDAVLAEAIGELIATPIPSGPVVLRPKVASFEFADPSLEKLSPPQKHLLRMGPDNARKVVAKLSEIRDELGLEP